MRKLTNKITTKKTTARSAFTLIELLVVISIIAVLMSVIMPAMAKSRQLAKRAVCTSNIRQLFLANTGYANENNHQYVLAAKDIWGNNLHRWHGTRTSVNKSFDPAKSPLKNYLGDGEIKRCPEFKKRNYYEQAGQNSSNFEAGCGGYGYNDEYIGARSDLYGMGNEAATHSARDFEIKNPASSVMFTDTAFRQQLSGGQDTFIEYSFAHPPYWTWYLEFAKAGSSSSGINGRPDPTIHFRHGKFTNVVWADGHTSNETMELSAAYVTHAIMTEKETTEMSLGWFGPDNNSLFDLK
ncbi:MAG: type II secretion system protein [Sedimentisphaeraceae bacterium JB056]